MLALLGFPPFPLFASELALARAGFAAHLGWIIAAALVLLLVAFAGLAGHAGRMLLGGYDGGRHESGSPGHGDGPGPGDSPSSALSLGARFPLITALVVLAGLGVSLWPVSSLLAAAAQAGH